MLYDLMGICKVIDTGQNDRSFYRLLQVQPFVGECHIQGTRFMSFRQ